MFGYAGTQKPQICLFHGLLGNYIDWVSGTRVQRWAEDAGFDVTWPEELRGHDWDFWDSQTKKVVDWLPLWWPTAHRFPPFPCAHRLAWQRPAWKGQHGTLERGVRENAAMASSGC